MKTVKSVILFLIFTIILIISCEQPCQHSNITWQINGANHQLTCKDCGKLIDKEIPHTFDHGYIKTAANCEHDGIQVFTCYACGFQKEEAIKGGHKYSKEEIIVSPTCTKAGYSLSQCSECGDVKKYDLSPTGIHKYSDAETIVNPSCAEPGYSISRCIECGDVRKYDFPATGNHIYSNTEIIKPTCTNKGYSTSQCLNCGLIQKVEIPATGHNIVIDPATTPSCNSTGLSEGSHCSVCSTIIIKQEIIPASHELNLIPAQDKTCILNGNNQYYICGICKKCFKDENAQIETSVADETILSGHDSIFVPTINPTCIEPGCSSGTKCSTCGEILSGCETIVPLGHKYTIVNSSPEQHSYICTRGCNDVRYENHHYEEMHNEKATCSKTGMITYRCSTCNGHKNVEIPKEPHNLNSNHTCTICGEIVDLQGFTYNLIKMEESQCYEITGITKTPGSHLVIPETFNNLPVSRIGQSAFKDCYYIRTIEIPETIKSIGNGAFYNCSNITQLYIPDTVLDIEEYAFAYCASLKEIRLSSKLKEINRALFFDCYSLTSIDLTNIEVIGTSAFSLCTALSNITLGENLTIIKENAFGHINNIKEIHIPSSVIELGSEAFSMWNNSQTIYFDIKKEEIPLGWSGSWNKFCTANIVWNNTGL